MHTEHITSQVPGGRFNTKESVGGDDGKNDRYVMKHWCLMMITGTLWRFPLQNTEILRALQKASGLSPDAEPIKLLSVPKGALGNLETIHR